MFISTHGKYPLQMCVKSFLVASICFVVCAEN